MSWFHDIPIRQKLVLVVAAAGVLAILIAAFPADLAATPRALLALALVLVAAVSASWLVVHLFVVRRLREAARELERRVARRTRELEEAQERLLRSERLAFLGQLAGGVSHELRRPLGAISNAAYLLKMKHGESDEKTRGHLEVIRSEIRNMEKIIHDLLDSLRIRPQEAGQVELEDWLRGVLDRRQPPSGVEVTADVSPGLPEVCVDAAQIEQVVDNLVTNAYQAMPEGGRLDVSITPEDGGVAIRVRDTGCGIPEEHRREIFEPLFTTKARGIGLGLTISKNFVEANGGRLEVESAEGRGSTFKVFLPACGLAARPEAS